MKLSWRPHAASEPSTNPREIQMHGAAYAINCRFQRGRLEPLRKRQKLVTLPGDEYLGWGGSFLRRVGIDTGGSKPKWLYGQGAVLRGVREPLGSTPDVLMAAGYIGNKAGLHRFMPTPYDYPLIASTDAASVHSLTAGLSYDQNMAVVNSQNTVVTNPRPTLAPQLVPVGSPQAGETAQLRYGVYTWVRKNWSTGVLIESRPSPVSTQIEVGSSQSIDWTTAWGSDVTMATATDALWSIRYYLTMGTGDNASFYLCGEQYLDANGKAALTYRMPISVGRKIESEDHDPPGSTMVGLSRMASGYLVGVYADNTFGFSKTGKYYAWPPDFVRKSEDYCTAVGCFDNTIVVATKNRPVMLQGTRPEALQSRRVDLRLPCKVGETFVEGEGFVGWSTTTGYVIVGASGTQILTKDHFSFEQWDRLNQTGGLRAFIWGQNVVMYVNRPLNLANWPRELTENCFLVMPLDGSQPWFIDIGHNDDGWSSETEAEDPVTGAMVFMSYDHVAKKRYLMQLDSPRMGLGAQQRDWFEWCSGIVEMPRAVNMGYLRVTGSSLAITVQVFGDGQLVSSRLINVSGRIYALPPGRMYKTIQLLVNGTCDYIDVIELSQRAGDMGIGL